MRASYSSKTSGMAPHQPSLCNDAPQPAMKGLAAAFKHVFSPRSSKQQHLASTSYSNKQNRATTHWLCGCTGARSRSSITSAVADAYLEAPLVVNRHSSTAGSIFVLDSMAASKVVMSPPSVVAMSNSKFCDSDDWKPMNSTTCSLMSSRQQSCNDKFSSYHSSVICEEQATNAAWRDFMSWRLKWMGVASQQRFSYREADLQQHEADLLQRLQRSSSTTLCGSDGLRASHSSTGSTQASMPPANAAQSVSDWEAFVEMPEVLGSGRASCSGPDGSFTRARRHRIVYSSTSTTAGTHAELGLRAQAVQQVWV